jgi:hypothetical protein
MKVAELDLEKKLTANQLFKKYKEEGGTLNFSDWLTREKTKGVFPLNSGLNEEINLTLNKLKIKKMDKTVLGFPVKTLYLVGGVLVAAVVISKLIKKK